MLVQMQERGWVCEGVPKKILELRNDRSLITLRYRRMDDIMLCIGMTEGWGRDCGDSCGNQLYTEMLNKNGNGIP